MKRWYKLLIKIAICTVSICTTFDVFAQMQVVIPSAKDNTLYESANGSLSNGAGIYFFAGRTSQTQNSIRRGLIAFDITGNIPANAVIESVVLKLHLSNTNIAGGTQSVTLRKVLKDWGEGTSRAASGEGGGAAATTGDATWMHCFFNSISWTNPGGDFAIGGSGSRDVGNIGFYTWGSTTQMVADVQEWLDHPEENFGWVLIGNETAQTTAKRFDSKENLVAANRPELTVTYTVSTSVSDRDSNKPDDFVLLQNYPNPLTQNLLQQFGTTIRFTLAVPSAISVKIYDVLGKEVRVLLAQQPSNAGQNQVHWNGRDQSGHIVAPGVYFYRLETQGSIATKRIVIVR